MAALVSLPGREGAAISLPGPFRWCEDKLSSAMFHHLLISAFHLRTSQNVAMSPSCNASRRQSGEQHPLAPIRKL